VNGRFRTLIAVSELVQQLGAPDWCVVDCRHDLVNPGFGRGVYAEAHIPGAVFLSLDDDLSGPKTGQNGRHPLPDPAALARRLGELGIDNHTQVIAYDDAGGMYAARLWWMLRWLGHDAVAVLDGGYRAWCDAGQPVSPVLPERPPATFGFVAREGMAADAVEIRDRLAAHAICLIDARSPDRFRGENESLDPVAGHIPGASNRFFRDNLDEDGRFRPADELRADFSVIIGELPPEAVIHQCGSGVTACHNLLAMEHAGLRGSRLYPGSWSEWCADPSRPVATGNEA
jgi:thiosulfate/3-mercaptopyruvate sulfurtransferase